MSTLVPEPAPIPESAHLPCGAAPDTARLAEAPPAPHRERRTFAAKDVTAAELERHINPGRAKAGISNGPLVGLALSGGGIRSATFSIGILQALRQFDVFRHIDYVSSVSGGGYANGWLQAAAARGRLDDALPTGRGRPEACEAREVRFLRTYSNYLTPSLGLFSGDTWAAIGNSVRNLILNLGVLSLSLIAPLYLPWILTLAFWRIAPAGPVPWWPLLTAAGLLVLTAAVSVRNMSQPLVDGTWTRPASHQSPTWQVLALVVVPGLIAMGLLAPAAWTWARDGYFAPDRVLAVGVRGGLAYAVVWMIGSLLGYGLGRGQDPAVARPDRSTALRTLTVLVGAAFMGGTLGTVAWAVASRGLFNRIDGNHAWLVWLLLFPAGVLSLLLSVTVHIGLAGRWLSDETREWWGRVSGVQLLVAAIVVLVSTLSLAGPHLWSWTVMPAMVRARSDSVNTLLTVFWGLVTAAGVLAGRSNRTPSGSWAERLAGVAPTVFVVGYLLILATVLHDRGTLVYRPLRSAPDYTSLRTFTLDDVDDVLQGRVKALRARDVEPALVPALPLYEPAIAFMALLIAGFSIFISRRVDLNEFSLHALYRNRLVRCYLGASHGRRSAHPFTGFDPGDDLALSPYATLGPDLPIRPYPLFNVAMNLVGGKNLAWQQRKAASFVFTPEFCGFEYRMDEDNEHEREATGAGAARPTLRSAYAPTGLHAGDPRSLTLGLALATSGAAASPNMGYHSSPTLSFLMTVFNVRLGWWLRNPRWINTWADRDVKLSLRELLAELLGMTTDDRHFVYLSDGGHFENLGVYELVRRHCRFIIACDGGQDGGITFGDLGNAIEKCRADFGIDIEIDLSRLRPAPGFRYSDAHCAIGTIRYDQLNSHEPPGTLLYLKSTLTGEEPADILRYAAAHPAFPHQSTADQFFDESQFESYRALGFHTAATVLAAAAEREEMSRMSSIEVFTHLRQQWTVPAPVPDGSARKYSAVLSGIWNTVRTTAALQFMDPQMFPAWTSLLANGDGAGAEASAARSEKLAGLPHNWLPDDPESRRAGFYVCNQMLQLMEDVYLDFRLDEHFDHIDNRGWMNLFQHWAWSGMLRATWSITGSTYDPRFQRFCRRRLGLELGLPYVLDYRFTLPQPSEWRGYDEARRREHREGWRNGRLGLNFFEVQLIDRFLQESPVDRRLLLMPIRVYVASPNDDDDNIDFGVGYLIAEINDDTRVCRLHHMRIQNHLRKMGLARQVLQLLKNKTAPGWGLTLHVGDPIEAGESGGVALDEALPLRPAVLRLRRIIDSLA